MDINEFKIQLSVNDINSIFAILDKLPYGEVYPLVEHLKKVIEPQLLPPESFIDSGVTADASHPFE
jgi:hypothetical protein